MGTKVSVGGKTVHPQDYQVTESSMPLAGGDSSGAVGTIRIDIPSLKDSELLIEKTLDFVDTAKGSTVGTIRNVSQSRSDGTDTITATSRLSDFIVQARVLPYSGTLAGAFNYYASVAGITGGIIVDPSIASRPVDFPGWGGDMWVMMKEMAVGMRCDLNLISNNIVLRPVRQFEAVTDREEDATVDSSSEDLAIQQEVTWYQSEHKTSGLIYPPGGWNPEVRILSIPAGEDIEIALDIDSSVTSVVQPVPLASVAPGVNNASVYTIVGDDNIVVQPAQWLARGGRLSIEIADDTRGLILKATGATGINQINGSPMTSFRIAMSAASSDSTYSTLRIIGDAVHLNKNTITIPTGVSSARTSNLNAPTIDSPFLNTLDAAYSAGTRGARRHSGKVISYSGDVIAINKRGETGTANYPPYSYAQGLWDALNYGQVDTAVGAKSYGQVKADFYAAVQDDFDNQLFGNAPGARVWDRKSGHWFRVRDVTTTWAGSSITADDDNTFGDIQEHLQGITYGAVDVRIGARSYLEANLLGLRI